MDVGPVEDERGWSADKRAFVADSRDDAADARDIAAEARDAAAARREAEADERETELDMQEGQLRARDGLAPQPDASADDDAAEADSARARADEERALIGRDRAAVEADRDEAAQRRVTDTRPTYLASTFASISKRLYGAGTYEEVLERIANAAVGTIAGGEMASVTLLEEGGTYRTAGATDVEAAAVDQDQYDAGEGPSLDAITTPLVDAPEFPDDRWPALGARPNEHGVESSLSYKLTDSDDDDEEGSASLNIYGSETEVFDQADQEVGFILAAHSALAARAVKERSTLNAVARQLEQALLARDVIGQAKGILMERLKTTPEDAFDILKRASQRLNVKLRHVALEITETGETPQDTP